MKFNIEGSLWSSFAVDQHRKAALEIIHEYYYALPNNGYLNHGLMSCDRRYKEGIQCALIGLKRLMLTLEFILIESNDPRIMDRIDLWHDCIKDMSNDDLIKTNKRISQLSNKLRIELESRV